MMWNVIRIAYFSKNKTQLMLEPVQEVIRYLESQPQISEIMLSSHWKFGPHIDISVQCKAQDFQPAFEYCKHVTETWLQDNASNEQLDPVQYEQLSYQLAVSELELPPYLPLLRNNSVTVAQYQPSKAIVIPELVLVKERFLSRCNEIIFNLFELKKENSESCFTTLALMMAVMAAQYKPGGIERGYISYRSHAEYFFENFDPTGVIRSKINFIDQKYQEYIDGSLKSIAVCNFSLLKAENLVKQILSSWHKIVTSTLEDNLSVISENYHKLISEESEMSKTEAHFGELAEQVIQHIPKQYHPKTKEHNVGTVVNSAIQYQEGRDLFKSVDFMAYRSLVNLFYVLLPLLDISPTQKFSLCHILANSVERVYSMSWRDVVPAREEKAEGVTL